MGCPGSFAEPRRLLIRESIREDFEALYRMDREDSGNPFLLHMSGDKEAERETFNAYLKHQYPLYGYGLYTLEERESHTVIGRAGFAQREEQGKTCLELGYRSAKRFRRMGYAGEAVHALGERMEELTGEQTAWIFCHPRQPSVYSDCQTSSSKLPGPFFAGADTVCLLKTTKTHKNNHNPKY